MATNPVTKNAMVGMATVVVVGLLSQIDGSIRSGERARVSASEADRRFQLHMVVLSAVLAAVAAIVVASIT